MSFKRILLTIIIIGTGLLVYWLFIPKFKFRYYHSKDRAQVLTCVTYPNTLFSSNATYLTPGHYNKHKVPTIYVKPRYSSDCDWAIYVTFHSKGIFMTGGNSAEVKNLSGEFQYSTGSYGYYSKHLADDSLMATFKHTEKFAIYSFDH